MNTDNDIGHLSIGGLSRACGIPVETLRNWERRYQFPSPVRRDSGHRRYPLELIPRLRLIRAALEMGYQPSFAVNAEVSEIEALLRQHGHRTDDPLVQGDVINEDKELEHWLRATEAMDAEALTLALRLAWCRYGAVHFIEQLLVPFLKTIGERWSEKRLSVGQEHFVSEIVQGFLQNQWRPLAERSMGPRVVLANLEGDLHCLGLHMAAIFLVLHGLDIVFLGPNTPITDLVEVARGRGAKAVVIGVSSATPKETVATGLTALRDRLDRGTAIVVGGTSEPPAINDIVYIKTFEDFAAWCHSFIQLTLLTTRLASKAP